jgi:hypothetical protein
MKQNGQPFGRRRIPIAEFKSVEEEFKKGKLSRRKRRVWAVNITPLLIAVLILILGLSPESRALAWELGGQIVDIGRDWFLRGSSSLPLHR